MWFWQQRGYNQSFIVWRELLAFSAMLHGVLLFALFFIYRGSAEYHIQAGALPKTNAKIVFLPLHKVAPKKPKSNEGSKKAAQSPITKPASAPQQEAKITEPQQIPSIKEPPATTGMLSISKPAVKSKNNSAENPTSPIRGGASKKKDGSDGLRKARKKDEKKIKNESQKKIVEQKKIEPVKEEIKKIEPAQAPKPEPIPEVKQEVQQNPENKTLNDSALPAEDDVLYVGRAELEALQLQQAIQEEMEQAWQPPAGLSKDLLCQIRVIIDRNGTVQEAKIDKGSGVLVYDVHARTVAKSITFPQLAWGKEIVLHFKQ